jgi:hypothetical protein
MTAYEELRTKYPEFFKEPCLISCRPGWYGILDQLLGDLRAAAARISVLQIKEKFAGLRFYYAYDSEPDEALSNLVRTRVGRAESESFRTCERCGANTNDGDAFRRNCRGWLVTLCDLCWTDDPSNSEKHTAAV